MTDPWWIEWIPFRALGALGLAYLLVSLIYLVLVNFAVIEARLVMKKGTEPWDWVWHGVFSPIFIMIFWVGWRDVGSGSASLPLWTWYLGVVLFVLGGGLFTRAMGENPFFEKTVRIQIDRDHHVIDTGPYRIVRHPGYVGMTSLLFALPLLLTSAWAFIPAVLAVATLVVRAALEDRTLQEKLPGYADYAGRVRFRLIPGFW